MFKNKLWGYGLKVTEKSKIKKVIVEKPLKVSTRST